VRRSDICAGAALVVLGLFVLFVVIPAEAEGDTWSGVSPLFFPTIIAAGFTLASAGLVLQAWLRPATYAGMEAPAKWRDIGFFLVACAVIGSGVLLIHGIGILWGGPVLVGSVMLFMGERSLRRILPISILPVTVIYFFVTKVLNAPLP
jgi:hypothetical protein